MCDLEVVSNWWKITYLELSGWTMWSTWNPSYSQIDVQTNQKPKTVEKRGVEVVVEIL